MLSVFPIHFLALFAHAILRECVGVILVYLGISHIKHRAVLRERFSFPFLPSGNFFVLYLAGVELLLGTLFIIGLYTQIAALLTIFLSLKFLIMHKKFGGSFIPGRLFYILLFGASCSLLITGGGVFAFDVPF